MVLDGGGEGLAEKAAERLGATGLHRCRGPRRRLRRLAGGGRRALQRRQRALQGVRRVRRAPLRHAAHPARGAEGPARAKTQAGDPRLAAVRGIPPHEHPRRHRRAGRRACLADPRPRARPRHAGGGELRRPHAQHHRLPVAAQRRHPEPRRRAEGRHDGLGSRRLRVRARRDARRAVAFRARERRRRWPRPSSVAQRFGVKFADAGRVRRVAQGSAVAPSICSTCARARSSSAATSPARGMRRAASSCRRATSTSACATRASCSSTRSACAR